VKYRQTDKQTNRHKKPTIHCFNVYNLLDNKLYNILARQDVVGLSQAFNFCGFVVQIASYLR